MCVAALVFSCPAVKSQHFKKSVPRIEVQNVKILLSCTRPVPLESGPPTLAVGPHRWYSDLGGKGEYAKPRLRVAQIWTASVFSRDGIGWGARVPPTLTIGPNRWYSNLGFALTDPPPKDAAVLLFDICVPGGNCPSFWTSIDGSDRISSFWKSIDRSDREGWWEGGLEPGLIVGGVEDVAGGGAV
jgi:hypothetical protein